MICMIILVFEVCISVQAVVNDTESGTLAKSGLVDNNLMIGIAPAQSQRLITITRLDSSILNITYLLVADNTKNNSTTFKFNDLERDQLVNSSHCNISSLEVYRGMDEVIEINHDGFSLSNNGNIEVALCNCI